ncbi:endoplasmic reticulum protein [Dichomitus squalens LYAD-421 SS1]|uniref:endoplasmic reticulum protein n=1 Tax=Dichomitus squalens (strain LYAD-421) TaxID=732165 RepID=UPI0004415F63|nr:endoplasmic reticulum protein [Dichomitus squalens LYAD-421 SS1]EJF63088.1 endoplasmic reticulum protein [Dichomitus squalens LYAD-421 SS1]
MHPWLLLLLPLHVLASKDRLLGVSPDLVARYVPTKKGSAETWQCLDGSKTIDWSSVNDDYCDCADGSDEPGTSACPDSRFYCVNAGHIGSYIPSTRVRDGLCELECCDGSDEPEGVCPNVCKQVGEEYRERVKAENKLRKTGSKIRSTYLAFAQKEKKRLEEEIASSAQGISAREKEVARLRGTSFSGPLCVASSHTGLDLVERTESLSAAALEEKKSSPLYQSLITHHAALKSLQREHKKHLEREKALGEILDQLRTGYNPNYQDMAVLEAVRGWEQLAGLPHINDVGKEDENPDELGSDESEAASEEEQLEEGIWSTEQLEHQLDDLLATDYEGLLIEHDKHVGAPASPTSILFNLSAYLPDAVVPQYEALRDQLVSWLELLGLAQSKTDAAADTSKAQKTLSDAEHSLNLARREKEDKERELSRLFDPEWYGPDGEWKKLAGTCIEKEFGDYVYEVCLFDEARQKPLKGGQTFSLGKFAEWNNAEGIEKGSPAYYSKQHYTRGAKCWNGPQRSVTLDMSCGLENAVLSVAELEKCEYEFKVTTPALCLPLSASDIKREEL